MLIRLPVMRRRSQNDQLELTRYHMILRQLEAIWQKMNKKCRKK